MKILLTGSSGFFGKVISSSLSNFELIFLGRKRCHITCDISSQIPRVPTVDIVVHSAGRAHFVPKSKVEKQEFFNVNVKGTLNLLKGLEQSRDLPTSVIFISSVSVYGLDKGNWVNEDAPLNATDPYGLSKIQAEHIVQHWCDQHNVISTILRLPLLAGPSPPGNLGAMIRGIEKGYYFNVAGGLARKSMVLATDVAKIIIPASQVGGVYNLTDGYHPSFSELSGFIAKQLGKPQPANLRFWTANVLAKAGDIIGSNAPINSSKLNKITSDLTFDDSKARQLLGWNPIPVLKGFKIS